METPPEEPGVPHQHPLPTQGSSIRREVPITSGCKNQRRLCLRRRLLESQAFLLKGPCMYLLRLTHSELQGSSSKDTIDVWGGTELSGFRTRAGDVTFSQKYVLAEAIVPLLRPPPTEPAGRHHI